MSTQRLGPWQPATAEDRLDRLESLAAIRQLPMRYGVFLDSRNMDALMDLFEPDVQVGRDQFGRPALRNWYVETMKIHGVSCHIVANHLVDFQDADNATGIVYCRDELEHKATGTYDVGMLQYWDTYVRLDGEWYFRRRKFHRWYITDALNRPGYRIGVDPDDNGGLTTHVLPDAYPSWAAFWAEVAERS